MSRCAVMNGYKRAYPNWIKNNNKQTSKNQNSNDEMHRNERFKVYHHPKKNQIIRIKINDQNLKLNKKTS